MYICKNCNSIHQEDNVKCPSCKINGMMVKYHAINIDLNMTKSKSICRNCGNSIFENMSKCNTCNFPIKTNQSITDIKIKKA